MNRLARWWPVLAIAALCLVAAALPAEWLRAFDWIGYAVCHRIPERSFFLAGHQLPVCARDTGMFVGALTGAAWLAVALPHRAALYPSGRWFFFFALCFAAWGFDGFNSYMLLLRDDVLFYMPQNWLRLTTGAFMGVTLATFAAALFNQGFWRDSVQEPTVGNTRTLGGLIMCAALTITAALWAPPAFLGPLSALSAAGVVGLLALVNAMTIAMVRKRHGTFQYLRELAPYFVIGALLAIAELSAISALRSWALPAAIGTAP
jgi:uncharacterized membrane protein